MKQQVNLYQPIFRKQRIVFSARTMAVFGIGFLVILLLWSTLIQQRVGHLESELERQTRAERQAVEQLVRLQREAPPAEPGDELVAETEALEEQARRLETSFTTLRRQVPEVRARLRPRLEALGQHHPEGLWLTGIEMDEDGSHLRLTGRALAARLVPEYLQALSTDPAVSGLSFRQVRMDAARDGLPGVEFVVSTRPGEQP